MKLLFIALLFFSQSLFGQGVCEKKLTCNEYNEVLNKLDELIQSNEKLQLTAQELEALQRARPEISLDPINIVVDKDGRVFMQDKLMGKLKLGKLEYDLDVGLSSKIVKAEKPPYDLHLKFKAIITQSYEYTDGDNLKGFTSGGIVLEPAYYEMVNLNFVLTPRFYGVALGLDVTEHADIIGGIGFKFNKDKALFGGVAFDF